MNEFLADLHRLSRLVGEPLPKHWMTWAFVSELLQHIRQLLQALSRMETITLEQLQTQARTVVTDDRGQEEPIVAATQACNSIVCYNCNGQGNSERLCEKETRSVCALLPLQQSRTHGLGLLGERRTGMRWCWSPLQTNHV